MTISMMFILVIISFALMATLCVISIHFYREAKAISPLLEKRNQVLKQIEIANNTLDEIKLKIENLRGERIEAERIIEQGESLKKWMEENGGSEEKLRHQIEIAKVDYEKEVALLKDKEEERDSLSEDLKELKKVCDETELIKSSNQNINQQLEKSISENTIEKKRIEEELKKLNDQNSKAKSKLDDLIQQIREKEADLKILEKKIEESAKISDEVTSLVEKKNVLIGDVEALSAAKAKLLGGEEGPINTIWADLDRK
ncbi:MAG: hypothetical protein PHD05_08460, partial [Sphaerochaetaceae bacterium]|nr:hypothetical protein [Sphaerochaetaceae bacterium]